MLSIRRALNQLLGLIKTPRTITVGRPVAAAGDYAAGDVISNVVTPNGTSWTFNLKSTSGVIEKMVITCSTTALTPRLTTQIYNETPTCDLDDNDPNTGCIVGDRVSYEGWVDFSAMRDLGTGMSETIATPNTAGNLPLPYYAPRKKLDLVLITQDAITGEAANMVITIKMQVRED